MSNANALKERINLLLSSVFPSVREHVLFPHTVTSLAFLIDDAYGTNNIFKLSNVHVITAMGSKSDQPTDLDDAQASAALHRLLQSGIQEPQQQPNNDNGEHHPIRLDDIVTYAFVVVWSGWFTGWVTWPGSSNRAANV
jgi:hypothetical protein